MRYLVFILISLLMLGGGLSTPAFAKQVGFRATSAQVFAGCQKAGGTYHQDGSKYECSKANCDGKQGSCSVTCNSGNCTGTTPGRLVAATSVFGMMGGSSAPTAIDEPPSPGTIQQNIHPIKYVTAAQLRGSCAAAGGTFNSGPGYHSCVKTDCDGQGGGCSVTCSDGKCTGSTPARVGVFTPYDVLHGGGKPMAQEASDGQSSNGGGSGSGMDGDGGSDGPPPIFY